jgi:hypothetical protein
MLSPEFFFGCLAVALCGYGLWLWRRISSIKRWPKCPARILKLEEEKQIIDLNYGMRGANFVPHIEVSYVVAGRE